jgi:hypothetical protein
VNKKFFKEANKQYAENIVNKSGYDKSTLPFHGSTNVMREGDMDLYQQNSWNPALTVCGADGLPPCAIAGNVLRPSTKLTVSIRLPPNVTGPEAE